MQNLDLQKIKNVHFIGIGGIGISAIARMMIAEGKYVTGQDMQEGEIVGELRSLGIEIKIGQSFENIPLDTDLIVYTVAIETYDKELFEKIKSLEIKYSEVGLPNIGEFFVRSYPEMLGIISAEKYTIAVCGTHGKTTTTGMIAEILKGAEKDPTVVVGSLLKNKNGERSNFIKGASDYFVVEACEYRRSFLNINPKILVITNIDNDHLDYYKNIEDIKSAFRSMVLRVPDDGFVVCNMNDSYIADVIKDIKVKVINWGEFYIEKLKLKIPGIHNKKDAACALAVANIFDISKEDAEKYVGEFPGTWKRFEFKGKLPNGVFVYDDYAHHPTEIMATLEGFRELYPKGEGWHITVVFQPHLFSRTKLLLNDFAKSFSNADQVMILPIYYAREVDDGSISSDILAFEINKHTDNAEAFSSFDALEKNLFVRLEKMGEKDIVVSMGAGEAVKVIDNILL